MTKLLPASMGLGVTVLLLLAACGGTESPAPPIPAGSTAAPATFRTLAEKAREATYRMDYKVVGPTGDIQEAGTIYRKPPELRIDRLFVAESTAAFTTIWRADEIIECMKPADREWQCSASSSQGLVDGLPQVIRDPQSFNITEKEGRDLLGEEVACFLAVPAGRTIPPFPEEVEVCLSEEGAPLFRRTKTRAPGDDGGGELFIEITVEATVYSRQVEDSDFDPPAEPLSPP